MPKRSAIVPSVIFLLMATLLYLMLLVACAQTPPAAPAYGPGVSRARSTDGAEMIHVPAGEFLMGSTDADPKAGDDEMPQHTVYVDAFWIDRTEVTNARYVQFLNTLGGHQAPVEGATARRPRSTTRTATSFSRVDATWSRAALRITL